MVYYQMVIYSQRCAYTLFGGDVQLWGALFVMWRGFSRSVARLELSSVGVRWWHEALAGP